MPCCARTPSLCACLHKRHTLDHVG
jgi:hypothetical protein